MMGAHTAAQRLWLTHHAERVHGLQGRLATQRMLERLWAQDASLWSQDPAAQRAIRDRLGWLTIIPAMRPRLPEFGRALEELRSAGVRRVLLLGMGGSALFAAVCRGLFGVAAPGIDLAVLDTTDPAAIRAAHRTTPPEQLGLLIASKSGTTLEVQALAAYFLHALRVPGQEIGRRLVVITDAGTPLEAQARTWGARHVVAHGPGGGIDVGGRYAALTAFGLLPAALIGVDLEQLVSRAAAMLDRCAPGVPLEENPAAQLACVLAGLRQAGQDKLTLLSSPALAEVGAWMEQMVAESLGKRGQGIVPVCGEPVREATAYGRDRVFVELQVAERWDEELDRRARALSAAQHPVLRIHWQDRYDLGGEVVKWSVATALAGCLLEVDPFDEPNVQEAKDQTRSLLERAVPGQPLNEPEPPAGTDGDVTLYGPPGTPASVAAALRAFIEALRPGDYLGLLSFLPRTEAIDAAARALRDRLAATLQQATILQHGPRYLHSTGQLFKGGPPTGAFLVLTADEADDLAIPGAPHTFGALKRAQALGDVQAMRRHGLRVLRLHLRDPLAGLRQLVP